MERTEPQEVWLESDAGRKTVIAGTCYIGRSSNNTVVLPEEKVSRRHAMIHAQAEQEYWLVDLGSSNGSYLNGRRLTQPGRLRHGDRIEIGGHSFQFRQASAQGRRDQTAVANTEKTIQDIKASSCWLLVADLEGSTQFINKLPPEEAPMVTGQWLAACRRIIEKHQGTINKFLGDGFFAYWTHQDRIVDRVWAALKDLRREQAREELRFRMVLHQGRVFLGGEASLGEESLMGNEVNFVFRMEKVAASQGADCLVSEPAGRLLQDAGKNLTEQGRHPVPGFEGKFLFLGLSD